MQMIGNGGILKLHQPSKNMKKKDTLLLFLQIKMELKKVIQRNLTSKLKSKLCKKR